MNLNRLRTLGVTLITVFACALVQAASITSSDLPENSNWYVHVNLELIQNSELGREFLQETMDEALDDIQDELGVDISGEIEGVTVFGGKLPMHGSSIRDGAVVLHGLISGETRSAVLSKLEEQGAEVSNSFENGLTLYTVESDPKSISYEDEGGEQQNISWGEREALYFSFGATQTLVTQSMDMMQMFIDANGHLGGFESVDPGALLVLQADRALMQGGANTTAEIAGKWDSSVLKNLDAVAVVVAEENDGLQISAQLMADSAEVAMSVRNIVEGLVALKALSETESPLGDVLRNVRFVNDGAVLHMNVQIAADQIEAIRDL
jgi:hypothetical protein